jgi:osmotically inducible lipoprotein OsmB
MKSSIFAVLAALSLALPACTPTTVGEQQVIGGLSGAAIGFISAEALEADDDWTVIATLAGAAAGALVARNTTTRTCAYSNGDGTYTTRAC